MPNPFFLLALLLPTADAPRPEPVVHGHVIDARDRADIERLGHQPVFAAPLAEGALYLRIPAFHAGTAQAVHAALEPQVRRAPVRHLVLDLRGNRGGSVSAAIEVADEFIDDGVLAGTRGQADIANLRFLAAPDGVLPGAEVLVLVDGVTASAAELLAGILAHRRGAILFGRATYGKSSVQSHEPLADGDERIRTIAHYYFDDGSRIGRRGLRPDITVPAARLRRQPPPQAATELPALLRADSVILEALDVLRRRDMPAAAHTSPKA